MKNIHFVVLVLFGFVGLTSCLKTLNDVNLGDIKGAKVFEIAPSEDPSLGAADRVTSAAFGIKSTPQLLQIPVYLNTTSGTYSSDVTVTLAKDNDAIAAFNKANGTKYEFLPDSTYTTTTPLTVVIPAGKQFGYLNVNIISSKVNLLASYMLSYKIVGVPAGGLISEIRTSAQCKVAIKNKWDGKYVMNGYALRAGDATLTGYFSGVSRSLLTSGVNSVDFSDVAVWGNGTTGIAVGIPTLTIKADNSVTITSPSGAMNDPSYNSHYDPDTKTFFISFTWGAGPAARLSTDTLVYIGSR